MKTSSFKLQNQQANDDSFIAIKNKFNIMKKLSNVSPFILLLVPMFVMMVLGFATSKNNQNHETANLKTTTTTTGTIVKATASILK